ncbi:MAG: hypothetical protein ACU0DW_04405 [Shimia sp.]
MRFALALILSLSAPAVEALSNAEAKAHLSHALSLSDRAEGARQLTALAGIGMPAAMDKLAGAYAKGRGVVQDTDRAVALYHRAVATGRLKALLSLGKTQMAAGRYAAALTSLERAVEADVKGAEATLAWAHASGRLGSLARRTEGWAELRAMAGDPQADLLILNILNKRQQRMAHPNALLSRVAETGTGKAAEALATYYRLHPHPNGTPQVRAKLLTHPDMREKVALEEALYLARDTEGHRFYGASEAIVDQAGAETYARLLTVTGKINKNAWVRLLQRDLARLGYAPGRISGRLTARTIRATNRFCRDRGITKACAYGPLKSVAVKAIATELASLRSTGA